MNELQYRKPEGDRTDKGPLTSVWINSSTFLARCPVEGKGFACILPARQGSQMGSSLALELMVIPVTRLWLTSLLIPSRGSCDVQVDDAKGYSQMEELK